MAGEDVRSWAAREGLSDEIADVLEHEDFTLKDPEDMGPDEVIETFQTGKLLKAKQCVALRGAIAKLSGGVAGPGIPDKDGSSSNLPNRSGHVLDKVKQFDKHCRRSPWPPGLKIIGQADAQPPKQGFVSNLLGKAKGPREEFRIILLGKTGSGKSTTGNTILGEKKFSSAAKFSSVTTDCELHRAERNGLLEIMDCPGLYDTSKSQSEVSVSIVQAVGCTHPGPHAILYVIRVGRYTSEDFGVYNRLKALFDDNIVNHMIVLFTGGDDMKRDKATLADLMKSAPKELLKVVEECGDRCLVFDNTAERDRKQVDVLFEQIRRMKAKNGDQPYNCPKYTEIGEGIEKEVDRRLEAVHKKELESQNLIKQLQEDIQKVQQELEASRKSLAEHDSKAKREIEEKQTEAEEEAKEQRRRIKETEQDMSEENKNKAEQALADKTEEQRRQQQEMIKTMKRHSIRGQEEIDRREERRRDLEERRDRERREMEERKEGDYMDQMNRVKDGLAKNEEAGFLKKVVRGVANVISKSLSLFESWFESDGVEGGGSSG